MLFTYKYIPHAMEKMQTFIDFIFYEVWCKAPSTQYGIHLYTTEPDLHKIMKQLFLLDSAGQLKEGSASLFFYEGVNGIFNEFKSLEPTEIADYKSKFTANNKIEELCRCDTGITPANYESLNPAKDKLNEKIGEFFKKLYSSGFFDLKFVKDIIGVTLADHYRSFVQKNDDCICPFCGLQPLDGQYDPTREAYDHYLPKGKYPFNSVNLKNLAPSCSKCNSGNKQDCDPLHDKAHTRRKAFYPFSVTDPNISISVTIKEKVWSPLTPEKLSIDIQSDTFPDEAKTWIELFRIEQRYASRCCNKNGGLHWLNRVIAEHKNYKLSRQEMFATEIESATASPWADANFLKRAFLEGCNRAGLFENIESTS